MGNKNLDRILRGKKAYYNAARGFNWVANNVDNHFDLLHDAICYSLENNEDINLAIGVIAHRAKTRQRKNIPIAQFKHKKKAPAGWNMKAGRFFIAVNNILKENGYPEGCHAMNGGEKTFGRYSVDFYMPHYGIVCEYNEPRHYLEKQAINREMHRRWYLEIITNLPLIVIHEDNETPQECYRRIVRNIALWHYKKSYA
jgi:hypothetical protein